MTTREIITAVCRGLDTTQIELAKHKGWTPTQFALRLSRETLRADDLFEILDKAGIDVTLTVRETGEVLTTYVRGAGRRVRCMVNKVIYDTSHASALSNNFYEDGENEYTEGRATELYVDPEGRYFLAEYFEHEDVKDRITPIPAEMAADYITRHGTKLFKKSE